MLSNCYQLTDRSCVKLYAAELSLKLKYYDLIFYLEIAIKNHQKEKNETKFKFKTNPSNIEI